MQKLSKMSMELNKIKISTENKQQILFQIRVLNEYCDKSENLTDGEVLFLKKTLPDLIGLLPMKVDLVKDLRLPFERLVINESVCKKNRRLKNLADLRYPPREIQNNMDYNRASLKGQTVFYAGTKGSLPNSIEIQPQKGKVITESKWKFNSGILKMLVICQDANLAMSNPNELLKYYNEYERLLHQLDANTKEVVESAYMFIIKAFTRKVNSQIKQGYLFSALLSNLFFTNKENPVDAIYYPSVANNGSVMNIAILPNILDKQFRMIEATESIVVSNPGKNKWGAFTTGICKCYDEDTLELNWVDQVIPTNGLFDNIMQEYNIDLN